MPTLSVAVAVTVTLPDTVALFAGAVICVVGGVTSFPVPVNVLVCVPALLLTLRVAVLEPYPAGVKVTLIVHVELPASVVPQLFVCAKSPALVPVIDTLIPVREDVGPFDRVTAWGALLTP